MHMIRSLCNSPETFARRVWRGKHMIACEQTKLRAVVLVGCFIKVCLGQGSPTFLKLRATSCVPINAKGYRFDTHI